MSGIDKVKEACKLLEGIEVVEKEEEGGKVTRSFLRKAIEMLDEVNSKDEYLISVGYVVARKEGEDNIKFFKKLRELTEGLGDNWKDTKDKLKGVFEYTIKLYHIKLKLGEDLCTKL